MARSSKEIAEFKGQGAIGSAGRGPEGSLAGQYASDAASLSGLAGAVGRLADRQAAAEGQAAGAAAGLEGKPEIGNRSSIYGASYEAAALRTYADRLDAKQYDGIWSVYQQHRDDPAALAKKLADLKQQMLQEDVIDHPVVRGTFELRFDRNARAYQHQALEAADARAREAGRAASATALDAGMANLSRIAYGASPDEAGAATVDAELTRVHEMIDRAEAARTISPGEAARLKQQASLSRVEAQALGTLEQLPADRRQDYIRGIADDWQAGKGLAKDLDLAGVSRLTTKLEARQQSDAVAAGVDAASVQRQVARLQGAGAQGYDIPDDEWRKLEIAAARVPGGGAVVEGLRQEAAVFSRWRAMPPVRLEEELAGEAARGAPAGRLEAGRKLLKSMRDTLATDPLDWAARSGLVREVPALDLADPGTTAHRVALADEVARHYGVKPVYLRPAEKQAVAQAVAEGGDQLVGMAEGIVRGFGPAAGQVLQEVSKDAPLLAHMGGVLGAGGFRPAAEHAAAALKLRKEPGYKPPAFPAAALAGGLDRVYGDVFDAFPDTKQSAAAMGRLTAEYRFAMRGGDPKLEDAETRGLYERALQEAAGATWGPDGTQYGGVGERSRGGVLGWYASRTKVMVPQGVRADRFDDVVEAIRDEDLVALGPAADGRPLTADVVSSGHLVTIAPGRYRIAAGDPKGDAPQWVERPDGSAWVLDLNVIEEPLRRRVPRAFR